MMTSYLTKIIRYGQKVFWETNITILVGIMAVLAILVIFFPLFLFRWLLNEPVPILWRDISIIIGAFIVGLAGLVQLIRRETYGIWGKNKFIASLSGIIILITGWGLGLILIIITILS